MKLTGLTGHQVAELHAIAERDPLLNLGVKATTADVPHPEETLGVVLGTIKALAAEKASSQDWAVRSTITGRNNALHSVKRKLQAQLNVATFLAAAAEEGGK